MSVLADHQIEAMALMGMIQPVKCGMPARDGTLSAGPTSYGYDITLGWEFREIKPLDPLVGSFPNTRSILDPKRPNPDFYVKKIIPKGESYYLPPFTYSLGVSVEHFDLPRDLIAICVGKSTYARAGLTVNVTPLEPEWRGYLTIEFKNDTPYWLRLYPGEGIAQLVFIRAEENCRFSYADKQGKYQDQAADPTLPKI